VKARTKQTDSIRATEATTSSKINVNLLHLSFCDEARLVLDHHT
jgi:hypothetical protein